MHMKVNGYQIKEMDQGNFNLIIELNIKENLRMIKYKGMVSILMRIGINMKILKMKGVLMVAD